MAFKKLKVKVGQVTGTHTNFPTLIQPSLITGLGSITLAEAQSARFYSDVGKTTEIAREIVSADEIHVKVTSMEALAEIWMDYDGIRSDYAVTATYGRNAVWSAKKMVSHDGGATLDSAGNFTLSGQGGITSGGETGQIGNATLYDGVNDYVSLQGNAINPNNDYTYSAWVELNEDNAQNALFGVANGGIISPGYYMFILRNDSFGAVMQVDAGGGGAQFPPTGSETLSVSDGLSLLHITRNGNVYSFYANGVLQKSGTNTLSGLPTGLIDTIGWSNAGSGNYVDASVSEARSETNALSNNWITTEYNNQNDNAAFWEATDAGGGGSTPAQAARRGAVMMM